jgi:bacillithiol system protein YtxJ
MFYFDLLTNRNIFNEINPCFQILHQSPQILVIQDQEVIHHASHSATRI